ncbi:MAG TPA: DUF3298 domain-containing protein [Rhizomicrobium sp.]|jgi:uncharacterized protein YecT (DUF1311 family)
MTRIALALIAVAVLAGPAAAKGTLPVRTIHIKQETKHDLVDVSYPQTGTAAIDRDIAAEIASLRGQYAYDPSDTYSSHYSLDVSYAVARNDARLFIVVLNIESYSGGAHPNHDIETFSYLMPDGWRVYLPEIFDGSRALKRISALAVRNLTKEIGGPGGMTDADWIARGAGPDWNNFRAFVLLPKTLVLHFPDYQVAAYAAGAQQTEIPLSALGDVMRKDWRTPVASFDCAKAAAPAERAICSDVALARLDRDVAQAYARKLDSAEDAPHREALRQEQRKWAASRETTCQRGPAQIPCLQRLYRGRLKALRISAG